MFKIKNQKKWFNLNKEKIFQIENLSLDLIKKEILNDLIYVKNLTGDFPSMSQYKKYGHHNPSTVIRKFGSWIIALKKIGFKGTKNDKKNLVGENNPAAKMTKDLVVKIKKELKNEKGTVKQVAEKFNIPIDRVYKIRSGKTWKHVVV